MDNYIKTNVKLMKDNNEFSIEPLERDTYKFIDKTLSMLNSIGYRYPLKSKESEAQGFSFTLPKEFTANKYSKEAYLTAIDKSLESYITLVNIHMTKTFSQLGYSENFLKESRYGKTHENVREYVRAVHESSYFNIKKECMIAARDILPFSCIEINKMLTSLI